MKWTIIIIMTTTTWLRNCSTIECRTKKWVTAITTWTWLIFIFFWKIHQCVIIACRNVNAGKKKGSKYSIGVSDSIEASHRSRSKHVWKSQSLNQNKWAGARESHFGQPSHDANINSTFLLIFFGRRFQKFRHAISLVFFKFWRVTSTFFKISQSIFFKNEKQKGTGSVFYFFRHMSVREPAVRFDKSRKKSKRNQIK